MVLNISKDLDGHITNIVLNLYTKHSIKMYTQYNGQAAHYT